MRGLQWAVAVVDEVVGIRNWLITVKCKKSWLWYIWIEANDAQIRKRQWPRNATDICIIFLQNWYIKQIDT